MLGIKGQIRIIEATLAMVIVVFAILLINAFYVSIIGTETREELSDIAYEILYSLNKQEILATYIYDENIKMLESAIASYLSNEYAFNLKVYKVSDEGIPIEKYVVTRGAYDETRAGGACVYFSGYYRIGEEKHEGSRIICLSISGD